MCDFEIFRLFILKVFIETDTFLGARDIASNKIDPSPYSQEVYILVLPNILKMK